MALGTRSYVKECIDYEHKSADNPYVLTNFCKLLSVTYYNYSRLVRSVDMVLYLYLKYYLCKPELSKCIGPHSGRNIEGASKVSFTHRCTSN